MAWGWRLGRRREKCHRAGCVPWVSSSANSSKPLRRPGWGNNQQWRGIVLALLSQSQHGRTDYWLAGRGWPEALNQTSESWQQTQTQMSSYGQAVQISLFRCFNEPFYGSSILKKHIFITFSRAKPRQWVISWCFTAHLRGNILINNSGKQFYLFFMLSLQLQEITIQIIL